MPTLQATRVIRYAGKDRQPGEQFDASDKDAKILLLSKRAKPAEGVPASPSDLPREVMNRAVKAEPVAEVVEDEAPKSQTYHRRDIVAETPAKAPGRRGRPKKSQ